MSDATNPKLEPAPGSNTERNLDDSVSGDDLMTNVQSSR